MFYVYDKVNSQDAWGCLFSVEKQEAMLQSVMLAGYDGETRDGEISYISWLLDYFIECNGTGITLENYGLVVTAANSSVTISFKSMQDSEIYFTIHDLIVNLDYAEDAVTSITLTFPAAYVYSFDSIGVICQPMDKYVEQVSALKARELEDIHKGTDTVTGTIPLDKASVLLLDVTYSIGWTTYVDGERAELYQANYKNMVLVLDAGVHNVELIYNTPYLQLDVAMSVVGFVIFLAITLGDQYSKCRKQME